MYVVYLFRVNNNVNNKPPDALLLMVNQATKEVKDWRLCPLMGKAINTKKPISKGSRAVHNNKEFDLFRESDNNTPFATLTLKKLISQIQPDDTGYFTQESPRIERTVVFVNREFMEEPTSQRDLLFIA